MAKNIKFILSEVGGRKVEQTFDSIDSSMGGMLKVGAAITGVLVGVKKAFDFGKEGANIDQLTESFERVNKETFKMPSLLEDLREASRGTVTDVGLMKSVMTLTAGSSEELGKKLASASPKLLEIAKAANKLNPTLGDTAFFYESISTGIKRGSPLILDNLGIIVKLGKANEAYAEKLGKTVEELSAEEKQLALLNNVMDEAGQRLINQAGGVDSVGDKYGQAEVRINTFIDRLKTGTNSVVGPAVTVFLALDTAMSDLYKGIDDATKDDPILRGVSNLVLWERAIKDIIGVFKSGVGVIDSFFDALGLTKEPPKSLKDLLKFSTPQGAFSSIVDPKAGGDKTKTIGIIKELQEQAKKLQENLSNATSRGEITRLNIALAETEKKLKALALLGKPRTRADYQTGDRGQLDQLTDQIFKDMMANFGDPQRRRSDPGFRGGNRSVIDQFTDQTFKAMINKFREVSDQRGVIELTESFVDHFSATFRDHAHGIWEDFFGEANSFVEQFLQKVGIGFGEKFATSIGEKLFLGGGFVSDVLSFLGLGKVSNTGGNVLVQIADEQLERANTRIIPSVSQQLLRRRILVST